MSVCMIKATTQNSLRSERKKKMHSAVPFVCVCVFCGQEKQGRSKWTHIDCKLDVDFVRSTFSTCRVVDLFAITVHRFDRRRRTNHSDVWWISKIFIILVSFIRNEGEFVPISCLHSMFVQKHQTTICKYWSCHWKKWTKIKKKTKKVSEQLSLVITPHFRFLQIFTASICSYTQMIISPIFNQKETHKKCKPLEWQCVQLE